MKVGLVHGRFQPFHNRHKEIVDMAIEECDRVAIIVGISQKLGPRYPYSYEQVRAMIEKIYQEDFIISPAPHDFEVPNIFIGANLDIDRTKESLQTRWDILMATACISVCGHLPTHVYGGDDYSIEWNNVKVKLNISDRGSFSATDIRKATISKDEEVLKKLVPDRVRELILGWRITADLLDSNDVYDNIGIIAGEN